MKFKPYDKSINYPILFEKENYQEVLVFKQVDQKRIDELNAVNNLHVIVSDFAEKVTFEKRVSSLNLSLPFFKNILVEA